MQKCHQLYVRLARFHPCTIKDFFFFFFIFPLQFTAIIVFVGTIVKPLGFVLPPAKCPCCRCCQLRAVSDNEQIITTDQWDPVQWSILMLDCATKKAALRVIIAESGPIAVLMCACMCV